MQFAQPQFLILGLVLLPIVALFLMWARRKQHKAINALGNDELIARLSADTNWRGRRWRTFLRLLSLTFLVIALATSSPLPRAGYCRICPLGNIR